MTQSQASAQAVAPQPKSFLREAADIARAVAVALVVATAFKVIFFQPFTIPSSSMEPGLVTGDYILVSKFTYGWSRASLPFNPPLHGGRLFGRAPSRGDVVVFRLPRDPRQTYIKRIVGLPGDRIQVLTGRLIVNDRPLTTTALNVGRDHDNPDRAVVTLRESQDGRTRLTYGGVPGHEGDETSVYVVPRDSYFVMGDNRDNSLDSRWPAEIGVGFLPADNLLGKAEFVAASWRPRAALTKPWTWLDLQWERFLHPIR